MTDSGKCPINTKAALAYVTLGTAKVFGQDKAGSIEVGKRADFVFVKGDTTRNIKDLEGW